MLSCSGCFRKFIQASNSSWYILITVVENLRQNANIFFIYNPFSRISRLSGGQMCILAPSWWWWSSFFSQVGHVMRRILMTMLRRLGLTIVSLRMRLKRKLDINLLFLWNRLPENYRRSDRHRDLLWARMYPSAISNCITSIGVFGTHSIDGFFVEFLFCSCILL